MSWRERSDGPSGNAGIAEKRTDSKLTPGTHAAKVLRARSGISRDHIVGVEVREPTLKNPGTYRVSIGHNGPEPVFSHDSPQTDHNFIKFLRNELKMEYGEHFWVETPHANNRSPIVVIDKEALEEKLGAVKFPARGLI